ncbi:GIY-YIG nuclease family protein [Streptomyces sp. NPDC101158]|uniref:GIY-YIG nuclease family protein n=1 Tax=Streptomyces sp. NPDC101158 TaxID=3366117 RepID=UPI0038218E19
MENSTGPGRAQSLPTHLNGAVSEETEVTSRLASEAELAALGYKGPVVVLQIVRTTFRADGTPIDKTLTIQGGSTPVVMRRDPADLEDDECLPPPSDADGQVGLVPAPRRWRTYLIGMEGSVLTKIGRTTNTVKDRVTALQTGLPAQLRPLLETDGDYERALHERFATHRVRGEWFDLTPLGDPVTVVVEAIREMGADIRPDLPAPGD